MGVTSNLEVRLWQHRTGMVEGFTKKYNVHTLVWFEQHERMDSAIQREKQLKHLPRAAKVKLIESTNSKWEELTAYTLRAVLPSVVDPRLRQG